MSYYRVEYRKGHAGVASRHDWSREVEADTPEGALSASCESGEVETAPFGDGGLIAYCADDSTRTGGRWEHVYFVEPVSHD